MLNAPTIPTLDADARAVWDANPHLELVHEEFGTFEQAHRVWQKQRQRGLTSLGEQRFNHFETERAVALARLQQIRNPASVVNHAAVIERKGARLVWWAYGPIGGDGQRADHIIEQLRQNEDAACVFIRIASAGGFADETLRIAETLRSHPAFTVAVIDRYAYSAASAIASVCKRVLIRRNATWMAHNARAAHEGNADSFVHRASQMRGTDQAIARLYASRRRACASQLRQLMVDETILTAEQAVEAGVCDAVIHELPMHWDTDETRTQTR